MGGGLGGMMRLLKTSLFAVWSSLVVMMYVTVAQAADPRAGAKTYEQHCVNCHGAGGQGNMPGIPNFARGEGLLQSNDKLLAAIENGKGIMPAYRGLLSTQEIRDVIAHLRTMH